MLKTNTLVPCCLPFQVSPLGSHILLLDYVDFGLTFVAYLYVYDLGHDLFLAELGMLEALFSRNDRVTGFGVYFRIGSFYFLLQVRKDAAAQLIFMHLFHGFQTQSSRLLLIPNS
jgi:hypothetical protein